MRIAIKFTITILPHVTNATRPAQEVVAGLSGWGLVGAGAVTTVAVGGAATGVGVFVGAAGVASAACTCTLGSGLLAACEWQCIRSD